MNNQKWKCEYTSAAAARLERPGYDGGGASGHIYCGDGIGKKIIAWLPHHRDSREDKEREANAVLIAAAPALLDAISAAEKMLSGIHREIELPGEWENGVSDCIDKLRESLAEHQKL